MSTHSTAVRTGRFSTLQLECLTYDINNPPTTVCLCVSLCAILSILISITHLQIYKIQRNTTHLSYPISRRIETPRGHTFARHSDCAFFTCVPRAPPPHRPAPQPPLATRLHWPPPRLYASFSEGGSGVACWPLAARLALLRSRLRCAALMRTKSESQYSCSATKLTWLELGRG